MKKLFIFLALMLPIVCSYCACSSDDDDNIDINSAVGTWMCTKSTDTYQGYTLNGLLVGAQIVIKSDGTYTSTSTNFGSLGTYTLKGNTITAKNNRGETFIVTVSVNGDKMTWNGTSSTGVTFYYIFAREF